MKKIQKMQSIWVFIQDEDGRLKMWSVFKLVGHIHVHSARICKLIGRVYLQTGRKLSGLICLETAIWSDTLIWSDTTESLCVRLCWFCSETSSGRTVICLFLIGCVNSILGRMWLQFLVGCVNQKLIEDYIDRTLNSLFIVFDRMHLISWPSWIFVAYFVWAKQWRVRLDYMGFIFFMGQKRKFIILGWLILVLISLLFINNSPRMLIHSAKKFHFIECCLIMLIRCVGRTLHQNFDRTPHTFLFGRIKKFGWMK